MAQTLVFLLVALVAAAVGEPQVLDSETFPSVTSSGKWLVEFYGENPHSQCYSNFSRHSAPWCTHCQKLEPTWKELSEKFEAEKSEFQVAKLDCTAAKGIDRTN